MEGEETDKMFRRVNCKARVAYLNGSKAVEAPPVELIQFVNNEVKKSSLLICLQHLSRKYVSTQMILILLTNIS